MSKILGYTKDGKPIHPTKPGMIYTACVISCEGCGFFIRGMGGPVRGAKCVDCYKQVTEAPDGPSNPASPAGS